MILLALSLLQASNTLTGTGNELLRTCTETTPPHRILICLSYVDGVSDGFTIAQNSIPRPYICIPSGVTLRQKVDVVTAYLRAHPESRHQPASFLTLQAMQQAWPCEK